MILSEKFNHGQDPTVKRFLDNMSRLLALGGFSSVKRALDFNMDELFQPPHKKGKP